MSRLELCLDLLGGREAIWIQNAATVTVQRGIAVAVPVPVSRCIASVGGGGWNHLGTALWG